ncbi:MAG TPA: hypothetical protein VIK89_00545 [Cytophagaceae bacterium]
MYKNGEKIVVQKADQEIYFVPKEKYGRETQFEANKMAIEGGTLNPGYFDGRVDLGMFSFDIRKPSANAQGTSVVLTYGNISIQVNIVVIEITLDKEEYVVNEGRESPAAVVNYTIVPPDIDIDVFTINDYKRTIKGKGTFDWTPFDNTGIAYAPGTHNFSFRHKFSEANNFININNRIKVIANGDLKDIVAEQLNDKGEPTGRKAHAGDTLYLVIDDTWKKVKISAKTVGESFLGEPNWFVNGKSISQPIGVHNTIAHVKGITGKNGDATIIYSEGTGFSDRLIGVEAFGRRKDVVIYFKRKNEESHEYTPEFLMNFRKIEGALDNIKSLIGGKRFEVDISVAFFQKSWNVEKANSRHIAVNKSIGGSAELEIKGRLPIPPLSIMLPPADPYLALETYVRPGISADLEYAEYLDHEKYPAKYNSELKIGVEGFIEAGVYAIIQTPQVLGYSIMAEGDAFARIGVGGELSYKTLDKKYELLVFAGKCSLNGQVNIEAHSPTSKWEIFTYNYSCQVWDEIEHKIEFDK